MSVAALAKENWDERNVEGSKAQVLEVLLELS